MKVIVLSLLVILFQVFFNAPLYAESIVLESSQEEMSRTLAKEADNLFKQDPKSAEANNKKGVSLRMRSQGDDLKESVAYFSKAIELNPRKAEYYHNRSISYSMLGNIDAAIPDLDKAVKLEPGNPEFYFYRALAYFSKKDYDKCWADVMKAETLGFRDNFSSEEGMFLRFIADLGRVSGRNPYSSPEQDEANARAYDSLENGRFDECVKELNSIIQANPTALFAYFYRALAYEKTGKFDEAAADYSKVINSYLEQIEALVGRGVCFSKANQPEQALKDFNQAVKLNPRHFAARYNRGVYYNNAHQYDQAIKDFNVCAEIKPEDALIYNGRAIAYFFKGEYDKSWDDLHMAQKLGERIHPDFLKELQKASGRND